MKLRIVVLSCLLAAAAMAADVAGKWTAEMPGRPGGQARTVEMTFQVDGNTLTGAIGGPQGDTPISDGKIKGDTIKFNVVREFNGNTMKMVYTGKVGENEIKFKVERDGAEGPVREFTAKRPTT